MLSSTNSELKNQTVKSIILAPFNSTKSHISGSMCEKPEVRQMILPKNCIKFSAKVKEINRQYELNNNADLDNGVYHQVENNTTSQGNLKNDLSTSSIQ